MTRRTSSLYKKCKPGKPDLSLFRKPTAAYRGTPFWSWNDKLDLGQLKRQIRQLQQMGFGGFHVHSRTGLADEYLGRKYMRALVECTRFAAKRGMLSWLYDEDRWPSGSAGGIVTRDERYRIRHLLWTCSPYRTEGSAPPAQDRNSGARSENGTLVARFEVELTDGYLKHYRRLKAGERPRKGQRIWYAYCESPPTSTWFNGQTYVDTLSRPAIRRFIEVTHQRLQQELGSHFGKLIPAIFTDEPQFTKKTAFANAGDTYDLFLPWTVDLADTFAARFDFELLDVLPELFWNLPGNAPSHARWCYHEHVAERFAEAFGDTIGKWCEKNNIALTGHLLGEPTLASQNRGIGDAMRPLRSFHIPGIDILCDRLEFTTAKQAQSIARQYDRPGVLSELYGVTNWDYDFIGHKAQGDWQAALGVTVRVPHLTWQSMRGEAKRDYPASIGYQSPWYREYPLIEDHFARLNTMLTRGKPVVRVAVIHPIESYWLCFGPLQHNQAKMSDLEEVFENITHWLLKSQIDFDFISEALLPSQSRGTKGRRFAVGAMQYDVVIVPALRTIRGSTLSRLETFARAGGKVIFAGRVPDLVDARPSKAALRVARRSTLLPFSMRSLVDALTPFRDITVSRRDGTAVDSVLYQLRTDRRQRYLFLCNLNRAAPVDNLQISMKGRWSAQLMNTFDGKVSDALSTQSGNSTAITLDLAAHGHALLWLTPARPPAYRPKPVQHWRTAGRLEAPVPITLSEPNVLLLDEAEWRLNKGAWQKREEILRIDNLARQQLALPLRTPRMAQPWADQSPDPCVGTLQLKFTIESSIRVRAPMLALEDRASTTIHLDGRLISEPTRGWWVDECIETVKLPSIASGRHELRLSIPMSRKSNVEWFYLLGDFGVQVAGSRTQLIPPVRSLCFGDWVHQGLPFYAGNVTYHCEVNGNGEAMALEAPRFKSPLLSVRLDSKPAGKIAFAPFRLELGRLKGRHRLDITAYGNRINSFGPVHNAVADLAWVGPGAWRHQGHAWADEYQLKPMGILVAPTLLTKE